MRNLIWIFQFYFFLTLIENDLVGMEAPTPVRPREKARVAQPTSPTSKYTFEKNKIKSLLFLCGK